MNCRSIRHKLVEYLERELPAGERAAIEAHLAICADCRAEAAALQRAEDALRTLSAVEAAPELTADLRVRLTPRPSRSFPWAWVGVALAAVTIAAAVTAFLLQAGISERRPPPEPAQAAIVTEAPAVEATPAPAVAPEIESAEPASTPPQRRPIVRRPQPPTTAAVAAPSPEPTTAEALLPEPAPTETPETLIGIILLIGSPRESAPSSSYYVEMSFPDGAKSVVEQAVERDPAYRPRAIRIAYERTGPETEAPNQGG